MKKYLLVLFLIVFIVPSVAFASWWNPFSWFNSWTFYKTEVTHIVPPTDIVNTPTTDQSTEIEKLKKEVAELKAKPETTKPTTTSKVATPQAQKPSEPSPSLVTIPPSQKPSEPIPSLPNYKSDANLILTTAINNYDKLINFNKECINMAEQRKNDVYALSSDRESFLQSVAFDPYLYKISILLYDLYEADIKLLTSEQKVCEIYFNSFNETIIVTKNLLIELQQISESLSINGLIKLQEVYSNSKIDSYQTEIQNQINTIIDGAKKSNDMYQKTFDRMQSYIQEVTSGKTYFPQYSPPPLPNIPPLIQTTHCTVSSISYGLQSYVTCSTF